jgi:hypothetical protein
MMGNIDSGHTSVEGGVSESETLSFSLLEPSTSTTKNVQTPSKGSFLFVSFYVSLNVDTNPFGGEMSARRMDECDHKPSDHCNCRLCEKCVRFIKNHAFSAHIAECKSGEELLEELERSPKAKVSEVPERDPPQGD